MMRIISPRGQLLLIQEVQPVCEKAVMFNGENRIIMGKADDLSVKPTALAMRLPDEKEGIGWSDSVGRELMVGNLKPEMVVEIIRTLCKEGYFDFSQLAYQKKEFSQRILDDGKSGAYSCHIDGAGYCSRFGMDSPHIPDNSERIVIEDLESPTDLNECVRWEDNSID